MVKLHMLDELVELENGTVVPFAVAFNSMIREVMAAATPRVLKQEKRSTNAFMCLMTAMYSHWKALDLLYGARDNDTRKLLQIHLACTIRQMFDAYFQAAYIHKEDTEALAEKYLQFQIVEKWRGAKKATKSADDISLYIANSPLRAKGEPALQKAYERVRANFLRKGKTDATKDRNIRDHWYEGNLGELANAVDQSGDHLWFANRYNSAVHSGPSATTAGYPADNFHLSAAALMARIAAIVAENDDLSLSKDAQAVIEALAVKSLTQIDGGEDETASVGDDTP